MLGFGGDVQHMRSYRNCGSIGSWLVPGGKLSFIFSAIASFWYLFEATSEAMDGRHFFTVMIRRPTRCDFQDVISIEQRGCCRARITKRPQRLAAEQTTTASNHGVLQGSTGWPMRRFGTSAGACLDGLRGAVRL